MNKNTKQKELLQALQMHYYAQNNINCMLLPQMDNRNSGSSIPKVLKNQNQISEAAKKVQDFISSYNYDYKVQSNSLKERLDRTKKKIQQKQRPTFLQY